MCFQLINACTYKEETALFPEVGVYHSVCYVLIGLGRRDGVLAQMLGLRWCCW